MKNPRLNVAVFLSGHGFGHAVRTSSVLVELARRTPLTLTVISEVSPALWPADLRDVTVDWRNVPCDAPIIQKGDTAVDLPSTRLAVEAWHERREHHLRRIVENLPRNTDLVVGDVPPLAFEAAARNGTPSAAIANFSWDWIYAEMQLPEPAAAASAAYGRASLLIECTPSAPMNAFPHRLSVGTLGRRPGTARAAIRARLGLSEATQMVLLALRAESLATVRLPPSGPTRVFLSATPVPSISREDVLAPPADVPFIDCFGACDRVLSKPGYGIIGDCVGAEKPLLWAPRSGFPEDRVLEPWLEQQDWARCVSWADLHAGSWMSPLEEALPKPRDAEACRAALDRAATALLELVS